MPSVSHSITIVKSLVTSCLSSCKYWGSGHPKAPSSPGWSSPACSGSRQRGTASALDRVGRLLLKSPQSTAVILKFEVPKLHSDEDFPSSVQGMAFHKVPRGQILQPIQVLWMAILPLCMLTVPIIWYHVQT